MVISFSWIIKVYICKTKKLLICDMKIVLFYKKYKYFIYNNKWWAF